VFGVQGAWRGGREVSHRCLQPEAAWFGVARRIGKRRGTSKSQKLPDLASTANMDVQALAQLEPFRYTMIKRKQLGGGPEWMDLKTTQDYADVSERTLREWIHRAVNPLPAVKVEHGKILIKRSKFDQWLEAQPVQSINSIDVNLFADEILNDLKKAA